MSLLERETALLESSNHWNHWNHYWISLRMFKGTSVWLRQNQEKLRKKLTESGWSPSICHGHRDRLGVEVLFLLVFQGSLTCSSSSGCQ